MKKSLCQARLFEARVFLLCSRFRIPGASMFQTYENNHLPKPTLADCRWPMADRPETGPALSRFNRKSPAAL